MVGYQRCQGRESGEEVQEVERRTVLVVATWTGSGVLVTHTPILMPQIHTTSSNSSYRCCFRLFCNTRSHGLVCCLGPSYCPWYMRTC